jgi:hypothetical protein
MNQAAVLVIVVAISPGACRSGPGRDDEGLDDGIATWDADASDRGDETGWTDPTGAEIDALADEKGASEVNGVDPGADDVIEAFQKPTHVCGIPIGHKLEEEYAIVDAGHDDMIETLAMRPGRILSQDVTQQWYLWDSQTHLRLSGGKGKVVGHGGAYFIVFPNEVRSFEDGLLVSKIDATPDVMGIADDGSYVWGAAWDTLRVWSPGGVLLATRNGNYTNATIFAAPNELRVALGPLAGTNQDRVETISVQSGASEVIAAYKGKFYRWFGDGSHFLTYEPPGYLKKVIRVYDTSVERVGEFQVETWIETGNVDTMGGCGQWVFWDVGYMFVVLSFQGGEIASFTVPAETTSPNPSHPDGCSVGLLNLLGDGVNAVFLDGNEPTALPSDVPSIRNSRFASDGVGWTVGDWYGGVYEHQKPGPGSTGSTGFLGCGWTFGISGSEAGRVAVATVSGILIMDAASGFVQVMPDYTAALVRMSRDGKVVAASRFFALLMDELRVYDANTGGLLHVWAYKALQTHLDDFELAGSGDRIAILATEDQGDGQIGTAWKVVDLTTGSTILKGGGWPGFYFSPNGTLVALSGGPTLVFKDATKVAEVPGYALGWITDARLLAGEPQQDPQTGQYVVGSIGIYDDGGNLVGTTGLPPMTEDFGRVQFVGTDIVYYPGTATFYRLPDGTPMAWPENVRFKEGGQVAGNHVIFVSKENIVYSIPYDPSTWALVDGGDTDAACADETVIVETSESED